MTRKPRTYDKLRSDTAKIDIHDAITAKIVSAIEAGAAEFQMPWHRPGIAFTIPKNAATGNAYRGSNILSLWIDAEEKKFEHQVWATYRQYSELGAQVRKGEKGSLIVKYGEWIPKDQREAAQQNGDDAEPGKRLFAKAAHVFNIDQVDAPAELREKLLPPAAPRVDLTTRLAHVDAFIAATGAEFREGGQRAFYRHRSANGDGDFIQMPPREAFTGTATSTPTEAYESTRLHELGHWTGAAHRLDRQFGERFGDNAYAFEEIVVEISAAYMCAHLEVACVPRPDHAQYIAHWLTVLKGDNKAIFTAASLASRIVDYLHGLQPKPAPDPGDSPDRPADAARTSLDTTQGGTAMSRKPVKPAAPGSDLGVQRIRVNAQGYDQGGCYWGAGPDVFLVTTADGAEEIAVRARNVKEARAKALAELEAPLGRRGTERDRIGGHPVRKSRFEMDWRNAITGDTVRLRVTHSRDYLSPGQDHVEIESILPPRAPLPMTETGYRSHFMPGEELARFGSIRRFVEGWLETTARSKDWQRKQQAAAQGDLFQWAAATGEVGSKAKRRKAERPAGSKRAARRRDRAPGS